MSKDPILYQNADRTVTLIDIPASIAHGQGVTEHVLSSVARDESFPSTEPKTQKAREQALTRVKQFQHDIEYVDVVRRALLDIRKTHQGDWSLPRWIHVADSKEERNMRVAEDRVGEAFQAITKANSTSSSTQVTLTETTRPRSLNDWDGSYYNDSDGPVRLEIGVSKREKDHQEPHKTSASDLLSFRIPSQASLLLADCNSPDKFRNHIRWMSQEYYKRRKFDFIILDPPWENRSAKRRAAYETNSVHVMIDDMDLSSYLQPGGLVGIWVTNKPAHRNLVLAQEGIFDSLNVSLIEEWIWIKTTTNGEPVTQLDGIWRKPYEVLLLGRAPNSRLRLVQPVDNVVRRVLAGVPDFHSRKPCLKTLVEPYLPISYQALEIFARYLVQGWTSWGDEVLKYNHEGFL